MSAAKMMENAISDSSDPFSFGPFTLFPTARRLEKNGLPVPLGNHAFNILVILISHASEIVSKATLLKHAWPNVFVGEGSLRFHVCVLRKALGDDGDSAEYVSTVQGQGYRFIAPVSRVTPVKTFSPEEPSNSEVVGLPTRRAHLVGRDATVRLLVELLTAKRFVTLVGPGGIGKTSVAVSVAQAINATERMAVCFIDLGMITDPRLVGSAVASALGITVHTTVLLPHIVNHLKACRILLVLDCCEQVIDAAADLAEHIFQEADPTAILVTSREPLRVEGEYVYRLPALDFPLNRPVRSVSDVMTFAAVQLFVERAAMSVNHFAISDEDAEAVALICRGLDGIPLALEFAAGQLEAFGIKRLTELLDERFRLLWHGHRTALPRHQTLNATLDWSYSLLNSEERLVLRRLAIFASNFTIESAQAVTSTNTIDPPKIVAVIASLVAKSLINADVGHIEPRYRLLDTTKTYALQKLEESGQLEEVKVRHATYFHDVLAKRVQQDQMGPEHLRTLAREIDDIRMALNWAFSLDGDRPIAIGLTALSAHIWLGVGLLVECRALMRRAIANFELSGACPRQEMVIRMALWTAVMFTGGMNNEFNAPWTKVLSTAEAMGDADGQLTALFIFWGQRMRVGEFLAALELAERAATIADGLSDPGANSTSDWMMGVCRHHLGQLQASRRILERLLANDTAESRQVILKQFGYDRRVHVLGVLSQLLWAQGFADQALATNTAALEEAAKFNYAIPLCVAKAWFCFNSYLTSTDLVQIEGDVRDLIDYAQRYGIEDYHGLGLCLLALCRAGRDHIETTLRSVNAGLELLSKSQYLVFHPILRTELAKAMVDGGRYADAIALLNTTEHEDRNPDSWSRPELIRVRGEIHALRGDLSIAERLFLEGIGAAQRQQALAWELRSTISLARLYSSQKRLGEAVALLEPLLEQFSEGFLTRDFSEAMALLRQIVNQRRTLPSIPPHKTALC